MQKMRIGVLMGGKSQEREVSFNSGRTVCDHLDSSRYEIIPIFQKQDGQLFILPWYFLHRGKTTDFKERLESEAKKIIWDDLKKFVDFVFIAMHGKFAEDGTVQGFLEILGIPYLGSKLFASAVGMDKIMQKKILATHGIPVAKDIALYPHQIKNFEQHKKDIFAQLEQASIQLPYIVKPNKEGSSLGVTAVFNKKDLEKALKKAAFFTPGVEQPVLIEEKLEGIEISCCVITDYKTGKLIPLAPTEIVLEKNKHIHDYEEKYMPGCGHEYTPARCSQKEISLIQDSCVRVMELLEFTNIGRIDGFLVKDKTSNTTNFIVIDPNSLTGMGPASFFFKEAAEKNINHTQLINHVIETELHNYGLLTDILKKESIQAKNMQSKKIKIAVLLGGNTNEKEISLESGRNIVYKLSPQKYIPIPIFVSKDLQLYKIDNKQLVRNSTKEVSEILDPKDKINWSDLPSLCDFVFIALHGGHGENGCVQGALEMLDLPYNGSCVLSSALCADKYKTNNFLKNKKFNTPKSILIKKENYLADPTKTIAKIISQIDLPLILKPHNDGCSALVTKITNKTTLKQSLNTFFKTNKKIAMLEEIVIGMELTVGVIGNDQPIALPPSQAVACQGILSIEEKFLPGAGENQTPAPLPQKTLTFIQNIMEQVYKTLDCKGYARIDCFYQSAAQSPTKKERVIILEVNTLPGMTPATCIFHQAAEIGIKPMDFIDLIIEFGFEQHKTILHKPNIRSTVHKKLFNVNST